MDFKKAMLALVAIFLVALIAVDAYTSRYDNINVDQIIKSDRLLSQYFNCLMGKRRCNPDGRELKRILPDALRTGCSKCNEVQKIKSKKIILHMLKNKRQWWNKLEAKYDPTGIYRKKYASELKKEGIQL